MNRVEINGKRLKFAREQRELSLIELSSKLNISKQLLWKLENGKQKTIREDIFVEMLYILNTTEDYMNGHSRTINLTSEGLHCPFRIVPKKDSRSNIDSALVRHGETRFVHDVLLNFAFYLENISPITTMDYIDNSVPKGIRLLDEVLKLLNNDPNDMVTEIAIEQLQALVKYLDNVKKD